MIFMIARIFDVNRLIGFRLLDIDTGEVKALSYDRILNALKMGIKIENLMVEDNKVKGKGGSIDRYTIVNISGEQLSKSSIIVVRKLKETENDKYKYQIADYIGNRQYVSSDDLIKYSYFNNIANGKVSRNSSDKCYIAPISGEFNTEKVQVARINSTKKYQIPKIKMGTEIDRRFVHAGSGEFRKDMASKLKQFNFEFVTVKHGIARQLFSGNNKIGNISNEILIPSDRNTFDVGITEVKFSGYKQFILYIDKEEYLVDDIIYIGNYWRSACKNEAKRPGPDTNDIIIALGQVGLLIIRGKRSHTSEFIRCIPYSKIDNIDTLTNQLVRQGITSDMLDKSDANYILNTARNCIYQLDTKVNNDEIPLATETACGDDGYIDKKQALIFTGRLYIHATSDIYDISNNLGVDEYIKPMIISELVIALNFKEKAYFSHNTYPIGCINDKLRIKTIDGSYRLSYKTLYLKHIAYYVLYTKKLISRIETIWLSELDIDQLRASIHYVKLDESTLTIYIDKLKLIFDVKLLLKIYENDLEELKESAHKSYKLNNKLGLMGEYATVNEAGYLSDWEKGLRVEQNSAIKGIELNDDNIDKALYFYVKSDFDVMDKRVIKTYTGYKIKIIYGGNNLDKLINRLSTNEYNMGLGITLRNCTCDELDKLMSICLRRRVLNWIFVNSQEIKISSKDTQFDTQFLIRYAEKVYGAQVGKSEFKGFEILDKDKIEQNEKVKYLKKCIAAIPLRNKKAQKASVEVFEFILDSICDYDEKRQILSGLEAYLKKK